MKKGIFCCTESVAMMPKSHDHMPTMSLWGVAKWPTRAPKTKLILCPRDPQGYSRISLSLSGRILKEYVWACHTGFWKSTGTLCQLRSKPQGVCEIALTEVFTTQMGVMQRSKKACLNCINLIHFCLTPGRLHRSLCTVIPGVVCKLLQFAATQ